MRKLALLVVLTFSARCLATSVPRSEGAAVGVTPSGLVFRSDGKTVTLLSSDGDERGRFTLQAGEKSVLSVADDGSRITSPWPAGMRRSLDFGDRTATCRLVFRDAAGNSLRSVESAKLEAAPAFLGSEAYYVVSEKADLVLHRASAAEGEVVALKVPRKKILTETGKIESIEVHASAAGVIVEVRGPYRSAYIDTSGAFVLPDPAIDCGGWARSTTVFPGPLGTLLRVRQVYGSDRGGPPFLVLQRISRDGELLSSAEIRAQGPVFPLPGGSLLVLGMAEAVLVDDRGAEISRAPFSASANLSRSAAVRLAAAQRRFEGEGQKATGADWVELALASPQPSFEQMKAAGDDPEGTLRRLVEIPDDTPDALAGGKVLASYLGALPYLDRSSSTSRDPKAERERQKKRLGQVLQRVDELAPGAPGWFRRAAAPIVLSELRGRAKPWALDAAAQLVERGEAISPDIPAELMTRDFAERVALFDRSRLDEAEKRRPPDTLPDLLRDDSGEAFHVAASRFPEVLFDCLLGAGTVRFTAAVQALGEPGQELDYSVEHPESDDEVLSASMKTIPPGERVEAVGRIKALLANAARSDDRDLRAAAQLLSPYYGRPLDAASFRRDVVSRPELLDLAAASLLSDRTLRGDVWTRLVSDLLAQARARSKNPTSCVDFLKMADMDAVFDSYCVLLSRVVAEDETEGASKGRTRELADLSRSSAAPPELKLYGKLGRSFRGQATPRELLELWSEPELSKELRISLLHSASYSEEGKPALAEIQPDLLRQLREGRLSNAEENAVVSVLGVKSPGEVARLAVERLLAGKLNVSSAEAADAWLSHIEKTAVADEPRLKDALRALLADENAAPRAAALLAKTGDLDAVKPLVFALKTGCFG